MEKVLRNGIDAVLLVQNWINDSKKALLICDVRQVDKTYLIREMLKLKLL